MRFNKLTYLHTDEFTDIKEIKFAGDFVNDSDHNLTVELWEQDDNINTVIMDNSKNELIETSAEEEEFILNYARELKLIK